MRTPKSASSAAARRAFTLMEVLLALFVFVTAVVSLVECINIMGTAAAETRCEKRIHARMESLLLDATRRQTWLESSTMESTHKEDDALYTIKARPIELHCNDGRRLTDIYSVSVTARWMEDGREQLSEADTWVWPRLFTPDASQ